MPATLTQSVQTTRFLGMLGTIELDDVPSTRLRHVPPATQVVRATEAVVASSMDFRLAGNFTGNGQ